MKKTIRALFPLFLTIALFLSACSVSSQSSDTTYSLDTVPDYAGTPYVTINDNEPSFSDTDLEETSFESYSSLDDLGRCGVAYACISKDTMPTEDRGSIGQVKPSGWQTVKYDCVEGKYLYNRCHLIGYQLTAENANEQNLITGTRYLNVDGMLPFENMVADYIKETDNHVLYRVLPVFDGDNLVASGVLMEAKSVEDNGEAVSFCVFCYNVQPGIAIDYASGESTESDSTVFSVADENPSDPSSASSDTEESINQTYILNTNTHKFHDPSCPYADDIKDANKEIYTGSRDDLIAQEYEPCGQCKP